MKSRTSHSLKEIGKPLVAGVCIAALMPIGYAASTGNEGETPHSSARAKQRRLELSAHPTASPVKSDSLAPRVKVNRTVPKVEPPKTTLEFSADPKPQEFFRARVFEEPLVPVGGKPNAEENAALAAALLSYSKRTGPDDFSSLTGFLNKYSKSPWDTSLLTSLGLEYYNTGHYSKAIEAWEQAWSLSKHISEPKEKAVADRAVGELALMYSRLGRAEDLQALLGSVEARTFSGSATERIAGARQGLWTMQNKPEIAFRCGPLALDRIRAFKDPRNAGNSKIQESKSSPNGLSLTHVAQLSKELGMNYQMAFRQNGAPFLLPAVINWKVGHYAAMVRQEDGRYLIQDSTFRNSVWMTSAALEDEASGYFLVPPGPLPSGWRLVGDDEGKAVWGKGVTFDNDPNDTTPDDEKKDKQCEDTGMAVANAHLMVVSLNITDTPVGYRPPVGPAVHFTVTYNQREANQPATFTYSNIGQKWTFDWLAYIEDNPTSPSADVQYYVQGGGTLIFTDFNSTTQRYASQLREQTALVRTAASSYEMQYPDGSKKIFSQSDGATGTSRKVFLKRIVDPSGNFVELTYDSNLRVVAITDGIGQVTTLSYENAGDIYKITRVTDPFGRFATFECDGSGRLFKITDTLGLISQFTYDTADFITVMTTPYGDTAFSKGESGTTRWLETTYPSGDKDRVEYNQDDSLGIPDSDPWAIVPTGMFTRNSVLYARNTFYWDKEAYPYAGNDYTKARLYHFLHSPDYASTMGVLESYKMPFENRVWYNYDGQPQNNEGATVPGSTSLPSKVGRVLDDGTTQLYQYQRNALGRPTSVVDPLGRTTTYTYDTNLIDLLEVRQKTGPATSERLASFTYNAQHLPLTKSDAAGQTTTCTYNSHGQLLTVTNAKNEATTITYDASGYLTSVDGPLPGNSDITSYTYDGFGRVRTVTNSDGYTMTFDYDAMNRTTKITYPDGTNEQFTYDRLDRVLSRDRLGRQTSYGYNSLRQLVQVQDALNRATRFEWCSCGHRRKMVDPLGRATSWRHDVQGRLTAKIYADGSQVNYNYENTTSRLKQKIDEKGQFTEYQYNVDDTLKQVIYPNAAVPTPSVSCTYDPLYKRVMSIVDGTGTTNYAYNPIAASPALGAGRLASIDGPLDNDTITYQYDELGRVFSRAINGVSATTTFDSIGRPTVVTNALGTFNHAYDGASRRLFSVAYPNGESSIYIYLDNLGDRRLQRMSHVKGDTPISQFDYTYNATGNILSWSQQADANAAKSYNFGYDTVNQVTSADVTADGTTVKTYAYAYDKAANRAVETIDGVTRQFFYNALNELTTTSTGPATTATYEWDAANRLTAIVQGTTRSEFSYDGLGRRVRIVEKENGATVSEKRFLWCGNEICEERDGTGATTLKRFFRLGVKVVGGANTGDYYFTRDHLGSVREMTDSTGVIRARYDYDPYGRRTKLIGDLEADFAFTGYYFHPASSLNLAMYRAYNVELGRWLSRDPLGEKAGPNLYAYLEGDPVNRADPLGLDDFVSGQAGGGINTQLSLNLGDFSAQLGTSILTPNDADFQVNWTIFKDPDISLVCNPLSGSYGWEFKKGIFDVTLTEGPNGLQFQFTIEVPNPTLSGGAMVNVAPNGQTTGGLGIGGKW